MTMFQRFATFFRRKSRRRYSKRRIFSKKQIEYKIKLLDNTYATFYLESSALGCDLLNQVLIQLDLVERDYFSLRFQDKHNIHIWLDPVKKLFTQLKNGKSTYELEFCVKFYAIDPDQLNEELTRYHFFLQIKNDILRKKIILNEQLAVDLAAFAIQSELGDYDPQISTDEIMKNVLFIPDQNENIVFKIELRHRDLIGLTPGECEIHFLKHVKHHEFYGIECHQVHGENLALYDLGLAPLGVVLIKDAQKVAFYPWNRINMIAFKKKNIRFLIHNRLDPNVIDKYNFETNNKKISKHIWRSAIEHHSFFRLIKVMKNYSNQKSYSSVFTSNFRYSGRTFYEASEEAAKLSRRKTSLKRAKTMIHSQRSTVGYIRIGSRVFARAENGEYFKGAVIALSDKVYIKCDDGVTLAHQKNTTDGIVYDCCPDPSEILIGTRVIAHWPGISNYLPGNISSIDGSGNFSRYLISFDDGDNHWNNGDQVRLLKPPMYFGPGSNTSYLQKKFSLIKTTTLVNAQINSANQVIKENSDKNTTFCVELPKIASVIEKQNTELKEKSFTKLRPRTVSSNEKVSNSASAINIPLHMVSSRL